MYDPEIIMINSELYRDIPELVDILKANLTSKNSNNIHIQNSTLEGKSILFEYPSLIIRNFLKIDKIKFK